MFLRHDNFLRTCAFVDSFTLSGSGFFGYNANLWFFASSFFFKLITLPCRLRVDNVLWFRFKNRWKSVFTTFDWCTASQLIWHTQSLTLSSVLSGNIGGYITFKSARKKTKKKTKWRMGAEEGSLIASQFLEKCGRKKTPQYRRCSGLLTNSVLEL